MKKIEIVFRDLDDTHRCNHKTFFDLYFDGVKQENVKRFMIDLPDVPHSPDEKNMIDLDLYTYTLEKYATIWEKEN